LQFFRLTRREIIFFAQILAQIIKLRPIDGRFAGTGVIAAVVAAGLDEFPIPLP